PYELVLVPSCLCPKMRTLHLPSGTAATLKVPSLIGPPTVGPFSERNSMLPVSMAAPLTVTLPATFVEGNLEPEQPAIINRQHTRQIRQSIFYCHLKEQNHCLGCLRPARSRRP